MKDYILGLVTYPAYATVNGLSVSLGIVVGAVPLLVKYATASGGMKYKDIFNTLKGLPFGKTLFSALLGFVAPYSASIGAYVENLELNSVTVTMQDRPWLRNPFSSVHALALANLGELASGLATLSTLQNLKHVRGIPVRVDTVYKKKARGVITCKSSLTKLLSEISELDGEVEKKVESVMTDAKNDVVAVTEVTWKFQKKKGKESN
mmetsp:Transcript_9291/g.18118  ORF Transcript_9291/g.18118 Transcript_9291/m.18118 type:complete len:207 (-) Transcript_9291:117-737(-)